MTEKRKDILSNILIGAVIAALILWMDISRGYPVLHCLCDGFFVAGVLLFGLGGLRGVRNKGAFDVAGYGLKTTVETFLPFLRGEEEDIHAYRERKSKERKGAKGLLLAGTGYLVLSVLVFILYRLLGND